MDNCSLRHCKKCGHTTVHYEGVATAGYVDGYSLRGRECFPDGRNGDKAYLRYAAEQKADYEKRQKERSVDEHICTGCGKRWVSCRVVTYWGNYLQKTEYLIRENKSKDNNKVKL